MQALAKEVYNKAITLPPLERIELIETLFFSLDSEKERKRIDKLWAAEAEDRLAAYETGELKSISVKEVFARIEKNKK